MIPRPILLRQHDEIWVDACDFAGSECSVAQCPLRDGPVRRLVIDPPKEVFVWATFSPRRPPRVAVLVASVDGPPNLPENWWTAAWLGMGYGSREMIDRAALLEES